MFTDGTKLTKPTEKIDVKYDKGYEYSAFITLTTADLTTLNTKKVKKFRLYIHDETVSSVEADKFKLYVSCIRKAK